MNQVPATPLNHVEARDAKWQVSAAYPPALQKVVRWKTLIGGNGLDWRGAVPEKDVIFGVLDLDPGGFYPAHAHAAPEIYFVLSGTAEWTVGDDTFIAKAGMAIYHASNTPHRMVNKGTEPLKTIWFWWAPEGRTQVLGEEVRLLEPMP
jgi:mannose-6-phosphate isomerase-like protein (cupin superfamily)